MPKEYRSVGPDPRTETPMHTDNSLHATAWMHAFLILLCYSTLLDAAHLKIRQGICDGGCAPEGQHNGAVAPPHQAPRVPLQLTEQLAAGQVICVQSSVQV